MYYLSFSYLELTLQFVSKFGHLLPDPTSVIEEDHCGNDTNCDSEYDLKHGTSFALVTGLLRNRWGVP